MMNGGQIPLTWKDSQLHKGNVWSTWNVFKMTLFYFSLGLVHVVDRQRPAVVDIKLLRPQLPKRDPLVSVGAPPKLIESDWSANFSMSMWNTLALFSVVFIIVGDAVILENKENIDAGTDAIVDRNLASFKDEVCYF